MRLEDDMHAFESALAGCCKCCANFRGVMSVIVNYGDSGDLALELEAPVNAAEFFEGLANVVGLHVQTNADGDGSGCIQHIVHSGNEQTEFAKRLPAKLDGELIDRAGDSVV